VYIKIGILVVEGHTLSFVRMQVVIRAMLAICRSAYWVANAVP
jgi:hypothetical protein